MNRDILCRPFPPELLRQRQGQGGRQLSYVETHAVIARLNEGCDGWSFEIVRHEVQPSEVLVIGRLSADGLVKMAFGGASITKDGSGREVSVADDLKAAASDALKKAASLLGVGLELYGAAAASSVPSAPVPANGNGSGAGNGSYGDRITAKQLAAIHAVARRQNLGRDQISDLVHRFSKERLEHLSKREASDLIGSLTQNGTPQ